MRVAKYSAFALNNFTNKTKENNGMALRKQEKRVDSRFCLNFYYLVRIKCRAY